MSALIARRYYLRALDEIRRHELDDACQDLQAAPANPLATTRHAWPMRRRCCDSKIRRAPCRRCGPVCTTTPAGRVGPSCSGRLATRS